MGYWEVRSSNYNNLNWVNDDSYLKKLIEISDLKENHLVLDVGTGTGVIPNNIYKLVDKIICLDDSPNMANNNLWNKNKYFIRWDIRDQLFNSNIFDRIIARQVFHHVLVDIDKAFDECYRILKPNGKFIIAEHIPPSNRTKDRFTEIFKLKEDRLTFMTEDLKEYMINAGFKDIEIYYHTLYDFSVKNWLDNSGLPNEVKKKIFNMYRESDDDFHNDYNLRIIGDNEDIIYDAKNVIITGIK